MDPRFDVLVIGGGAAGLLCAIEAGKRGRRVLVLERNAEVGRKILISGGGRCNFTNLGTSPERFLSENPDFCRSALARYTPADFVRLLERHAVRFHEKKLGQLFCEGSARQVVEVLLAEAREAGVRIETGVAIERVGTGAEFRVTTGRGERRSRALVVATGGLSIPKLGATDFALRLAAQLGLAVTETRPGLVPLRMAGEELAFCVGLAGASLRSETRAGAGPGFRESLLFTHRGVSGPAVLQASSYWRPGQPLTVDLLPGESAAALLTEARARGQGLVRLLEQRQPRRFAQAFAARHAPPRPLAELRREELEALARQLHAWRLAPSETEGFGKAEVTVGGIDTRELSSRSMECRRVPGLYFIGEAVDVTGWLGGYNFQWAWASGFAAGQVA